MKTKISVQFATFSLGRVFIASVIKRCIRAVLEQEMITAPCEINVLITDDTGIRELNRTIRQIDKPTDVLSFPMFDLEAGNPPCNWGEYIDPDTGLCPLGDMAISLERAIAQANEYGHSVRREVGYLTIHSMLHLLGYDHLDEGEQKKQMRAREEAIASTIPNMKR